MKCPHCGNTDSRWFETNGVSRSDPDFAILCLAPCEDGETSFDSATLDDFSEDDPVRRQCGMQWCPNDRSFLGAPYRDGPDEG